MKNLLYRNIAFCTILLIGVATISIAYSQVQLANSWIEYDQSYVKVGVIQKGIHKIQFSALPNSFSTDQKDNIQLWRRGKQIAILGVDSEGILFYGVPNDGSSDSLLFRPYSSRMNPYWSIFSDEGSYFLTIGKSAGLRSEEINKALDLSVAIVPYHIANSVSVFNKEYSLSTTTSFHPPLINSFYELGASKTGEVSLDGKPTNLPFQLINRVATNVLKPSIKLMINGRTNGNRNVEIYVGKDTGSLRLVHSMNNQAYAGQDYSFDLEEGDVDVENKGVLSIKSVSSALYDGYSIAYFSISYPQNFDLKGKNSMELQLDKSDEINSHINLVNSDSKARVLDITDPDRPRIILGSMSNLMVPRTPRNQLKLLVSNEIITVQNTKIAVLNPFIKYPTTPNYIIITSENLLAGAGKYAAYRESEEGGGHKTIVANIKDIYNQFNYGEPSPIAIRRFMDFMLSSGVKNKYLFLIGKAITYQERMVRELPDEVPSIGFPGSDILLVEGLAGGPRDVPALPVGRLTAVSNKVIEDYLQKVKDYESNASNDYSWRKKVLHLNGGKTVSEITQLRNILSSLAPAVENGLVGGEVKAFVKQQAIGEVEKVNITPEVNGGVGLITYFGHGSLSTTDLDMGYVTDANRGYNNNKMYPVMYFNGCGVGNVFSGRYNTNLAAADKYALSLDWLLAPNRGAIAIIANSFDSFVTPASRYLRELYNNVFIDPATSYLPIGDIQLAVAKKIISEDPNVYNVSNVHQSVLQGDPVLKVISVQRPDYAIDRDAGIKILSESPDKTIAQSSTLSVKIYLRNFGRFNKSENIPVEIVRFYGDSNQMTVHNIAGFAHQDTLTVALQNDKKLSKIQVRIDPKNTIAELNEDNNNAELFVDWELAQNESIYPQGIVADLIAPFLNVTFNGRSIKNGDRVGVNPEIKIVLTDDRLLSADTTNISIFLKLCNDNSCEFKRINYSDDQLVLDPITDHSIELTYHPTILSEPGKYELLVNGLDDAKNTSPESYIIGFEIISETEEKSNVVVSPNPATNYVRFETIATENKTFEMIEIMVYNTDGSLVDKMQIKYSTPGTKDWYWRPYLLPNGMYYYKVNFVSGGNIESQVTGKIALIR
jgi:hypothetical protein